MINTSKQHSNRHPQIEKAIINLLLKKWVHEFRSERSHKITKMLKHRIFEFTLLKYEYKPNNAMIAKKLYPYTISNNRKVVFNREIDR